MLDKILEVYQTSKNYPEIVLRFITMGITSYTVDVETGTVTYRRANGENFIHLGKEILRDVQPKFDVEAVKNAIIDNQQGKSDYPVFMNSIAKAGVRFYEATLEGNNKRVTYVGLGDKHEERIPL